MKWKITTILIITITILIICFAWWQLPPSINRSSEIRLGNSIIENIDKFRKITRDLPEANDRKQLTNLGFQFSIDGSKPEYRTINDSVYELYFIEGFDGPYLMWNSTERKWKMGFPVYEKN